MSRRAPTQFPYGFLTDDAGASADPVLVEIDQGTLASVEMEVETAIARTSRSPMIRDAHDFRAGIHDRLLRKLTGRSYSALVHPVARDFPIEEMREGDVFFHNDVYRSEGGIGHLPDLCVTVPVFSGAPGERRVVAFVQAFEVRVPVPSGALDADALAAVADVFHAEHRALYGYDFATDPSQQVEWVNLRVSGIGPIQRPEIRKANGGSQTSDRGTRQEASNA